MHFYSFHIGDYAAHTGHLDPMEDIAYRRLLDAYYLAEGPLPADVERCARLARMRDHAAIVRDVLNEFFVLTDDGWRHDRCDAEIGRKQEKTDKARASASLSVQARSAKAQQHLSERSANAERTLSERSTDVQLPLANSQEPITKDNDNNRAGEASSSFFDPAGQNPIPDDPVLVHDTPRAADRFDPGPPTDAGVIAAWLREQEKAEGRQATAISSLHPAILRWAADEIPHAEIAEAYRLAVEQRVRSKDTSPMNPGYVDAVLRAKRLRASVSTEAVPVKARPPDWQRNTATMKAKADEIGLRINGEWTADDLRWQITQRLRAAREAA